MRTQRLFVALVALVALPGPGSASASAPPTLAGTNVMSGNASGYVDVRLERPATIDLRISGADNDSFEIGSTGVLGGVMLKELGPPRHSAKIVIGARFDPTIFCSGACTRPADFLSVLVLGDDAPVNNRAKIPAGNYRMYLLAAGGPVTATLRLPELTGERHLEADHVNRVTAAPLSRVDAVPTPNLAVFGGVGQLTTEGMTLVASLAYYQARAATQFETCQYVGEPRHDFAWHPTCPADQGQQVDRFTTRNANVSPGPIATAMIGLMTRPPGIYAPGGSVSSVALTDSVGWGAAWIDFDGIPSPPATAAPSPGAGENPGAGEDPGAGLSAPHPPARAGQAILVARRLWIRGRNAYARLRCTGSSRCLATLQIRALGSRSVRAEIRAGATARVRLEIPSSIGRRLASRRRIPARLAIRQRGAEATHRVALQRR